MTKKKNQPWHRMEKNGKIEGNKAFLAFTTYLLQGYSRTHKLVIEELNLNTAANINRMSLEWNWVERTTAWDDFMAESARSEMVNKHIKITDKALRVLEIPIDNLIDKVGEDKEYLKKLSVSKTIDTAIKAVEKLKMITDIERVANNEPSEIQKTQNEQTVIFEGIDPIDNEPINE